MKCRCRSGLMGLSLCFGQVKIHVISACCNFGFLDYTPGEMRRNPISPHFPHASPHGVDNATRGTVACPGYVKGVCESRIFRTKREAASWAAIRETQLRADAETWRWRNTRWRTPRGATSARYRHCIAGRWEIIRIDALLRQEAFPGSSLLCSPGLSISPSGAMRGAASLFRRRPAGKPHYCQGILETALPGMAVDC